MKKSSRLYPTSIASLLAKGRKFDVRKRHLMIPKRLRPIELPDKFTSKVLQKLGFSIKKKAIESAYDKDVPVIELRGNSVVKIFKSGKVEVVKQLNPLPKIDLPEKFSIKP